MHPFTVTIPEVADPDLGALLTRLAEAGYPNPVVEPIGSPASRPPVTVPSDVGDLPGAWSEVRQLEGQSYQWPTYREDYDLYTVYAADTDREGTVHIALGKAPREKAWGRDRDYIVAFLSSGGPQTPLVEFLETDPESSGEMLAVVRGFGGGNSRKMYGPTDSLPDVYTQAFRTAIYRDHIHVDGAWNKVAVIAGRDDHATMLNHALVQARRRGDV